MRLPFIALIALLFCVSCAASQYNKTLEGLHGMPIEQAVVLLGPPTQKEANVFTWNKQRTESGGGYYTTRYETRYEQGPQGQQIMRQIPHQEWVFPYTETHECKTTIRFSDNRIITEHAIEGDCP